MTGVDPDCYGLTELGRGFCEYVVAYDEVKSADNAT
jgi:hypothetical protein